MFKKVVSDLKGLDIVINNAGIYNDKKWDQTVSINVVSKMYFSERNKDSKNIILISFINLHVI